MKTYVTTLFSLLGITVLLSFSNGPDEKPNAFMPGEYGTTDRVTLSLMENHTFIYINTADPDNPIEARGEWTYEKNTIHLSGFEKGSHVPEKWKRDKDHPCLRSNFIGMQVIRLCWKAA